ncbi:hypothetical protein AB0M12_30305 [Nocardia vinacea]|uniref:hypothetical protein n=1 Tax=Nocardia vinacea TaxID=96468 RepID=UPI00341D9507
MQKAREDALRALGWIVIRGAGKTWTTPPDGCVDALRSRNRPVPHHASANWFRTFRI